MLITTRRKIKKWIVRLIWLGVLAFAVWANYNRFYHNNYANYEKAVDYGRVREKKETINPVIAAVFYQGKSAENKSLSSYLSHWDNRRLQNPKMLAVPTQITPESRRVIEKLYKETAENATIDRVLLVYGQSADEKLHRQILRQHFNGAEVKCFAAAENETNLEAAIEKALNRDKTLVVVAVDLNNAESNKYLADELIYSAQRHFYKIRIFDEVDTQLARALEDNYASWFETETDDGRNELRRQQKNLAAYKKHYGNDIVRYFMQNLNLAEDEEPVWPEKNAETYRLFDRGTVYIRFFGSGDKEMFSRAKIGKNKGIIVAVIELARKAVFKLKQPIKSYKIYFLTDFEKIEKAANEPLINYLETDDGVYVQYRGRKALMAADERPDEEDILAAALRSRAKIPDSESDSKIEFYRFKTVEIENEN